MIGETPEWAFWAILGLLALYDAAANHQALATGALCRLAAVARGSA
jgi:hypothetical protein